MVNNHPKLLFIITGIGLGHTIREAAIINEIKKLKPDAEIVIAGFKKSYRYFKGKYPVIKLHGHKFPENSFSVSRLKSLFMNLPYPVWEYKDKKKLVKIIKEFNPDKVVVDIQPVGIDAALACNKKVIAVYNLDLDEWEEYQKNLSFLNRTQSRILFHYVKSTYDKADKVIIPSIHKPKVSGRYNLVHPILRQTPEELPPGKMLIKKLGLKTSPIVVMLGGSKFGYSIAEKLLAVAKNFDEHFIIFGYKNLKEKNITSFSFKENFLEYLKVSKAAILLSGHTALSEIIVYKKPALVFPFKNYVEHYINLDQIHDYVLAKYIDESMDEKTMEEYIRELLKESPRLKKNLNKLSFPKNGAREAAEIILRS